MQPISGYKEQFVAAATEKTLKDAATNTNTSPTVYSSNSTDSVQKSFSSVFPKANNNTTSVPSCPDFQRDSIFKNACDSGPIFNRSIRNTPITVNDNIRLTEEYIQPAWSPGEICYHRNLLRRSPVTYNMKILNNEALLTDTSKNLNTSLNNHQSYSNNIYLPAPKAFHNDKEIYNPHYGPIRNNLDSRLSSSECSPASSISKSENRYGIPHSRVFDLLDLQTVMCDPLLQHQNQNESRDINEHLLSR